MDMPRVPASRGLFVHRGSVSHLWSHFQVQFHLRSISLLVKVIGTMDMMASLSSRACLVDNVMLTQIMLLQIIISIEK